MTWLSKSGNLTLIFIAISLLISGCISQPIAKNTPPILSDVYTAPIGGFEQTRAIIEPNSTFETEYIFYSRNWGPGEVKYAINGSYRDEPFAIDPMQIHIEPSNFTAEPNYTYRSRLFLNTSALPKEFKPFDPNNGGVIYPVNLNINISLQDSHAHYGNDSIILYPAITLAGPFPMDYLSIANCSIQVRQGETRKINITFLHDPYGGIEEITFTPSGSSLNISVTPSNFVVKHFLVFPSILTVSSDSSLISDEYPVNITIDGVRTPTSIHCIDKNSYNLPQNTLTQSAFSVNVSVV